MFNLTIHMRSRVSLTSSLCNTEPQPALADGWLTLSQDFEPFSYRETRHQAA